jgi:hypothetical protein
MNHTLRMEVTPAPHEHKSTFDYESHFQPYLQKKCLKNL